MTTYIQISGFDPELGFFEEANSVLRSSAIQRGSCVFVTSRPDEFDANNGRHEKFTAWLANAGIVFESIILLDNRIFNNSDKSPDFDPTRLHTADCIFLMSGDTQKQMDFMQNLGIDKILKDYRGAVIGVSAGAINMARLGLVDYHVIPHFERLPEERLKEFVLPKSHEMTLYGMNENAVISHQHGKTQLFGDIYEIKSGQLKKLDAIHQLKSYLEVATYTSLRYKCDEELLASECLHNASELKVFLDKSQIQPVIDYACTSLDALYNFLENSHVKGAIHFVPKEAVEPLEKLGFTILGEYVDYFTSAPALGVYPPPVFATPEHAPALTTISQSLVGQSRGFFGETEDWFKEWLINDKVIIERVGQEIVGFCCFSLYNDGRSLWIRELAVDRGYQGRGIGKRLLSQALETGFTEGAQKAFLSVDTANFNAIRIYEACGFWRSAEPPEIQMLR